MLYRHNCCTPVLLQDPVNRRVATETLLEFAYEHPDRQFVFLTPQDIVVSKGEEESEGGDEGEEESEGGDEGEEGPTIPHPSGYHGVDHGGGGTEGRDSREGIPTALPI